MRKEKKLCLIITFHTTAEAMETEKLCRSQALPGRLIPAPRELTADCGIAWCAPPEVETALLAALAAAQVEIAGHRLTAL